MTTKADEIKAELDALNNAIKIEKQRLEQSLLPPIAFDHAYMATLYARRKQLEAQLEREDTCLVKPQPVGVKLDGYDI